MEQMHKKIIKTGHGSNLCMYYVGERLWEYRLNCGFNENVTFKMLPRDVSIVHG